MVNGTWLHYTTYTSRHPLCGSEPNNYSHIDCSEYGETTRDPGFGSVRSVYANGTGIMTGDRMLPVGTCLDAVRDVVYSCPPSPVQLVQQPVRAVRTALGG